MILVSKEQDGLCVLESNDPNKRREVISHKSKSNNKSMGKFLNMAHHRKFGHPSFSVIKSLFPYLFTKESIESLNLERGLVVTTHVPYGFQLANIFTKELLQGRF